MKRTSFVLLAALSVSTSVFAQETGVPGAVDSPPTTTTPPAVAEPSTEDRLLLLLSGYEYFPTREDLDAVAKAETMIPMLLEIARDDARRTTLRMRAVDALGYYPEEASVDYLKELVESPEAKGSRKVVKASRLMRHHAITAIARAKKEDAVPVLAPILTHDDLQLRLTTINALGKHGGSAGKRHLVALASEDNPRMVERELRKWVRP